MDIEQLTKTQTILLTLLVSFVTSIATGIVTVSLVDQAPPALTQTINRVVERTVERVVPTSMQGAAAVGREVTVVVKEEDLITGSIDKNTRSVARIFGLVTDEETGQPVSAFLGLGIVLTRDGLMVTDASIVYEGGSYTVTDAAGNSYDAKVVHIAGGEGRTALLQAVVKKDASTAFTPATLTQQSTLKLGQSVLTLAGRDRTNVSLGIVGTVFTEDIPASVDESGKKVATTTVAVLVDTSIPGAISAGSPLVNIFSEVVGISTGSSRARSRSAFLPARVITDELAAYTAKSNTKSAQ
jgi:hypothetical protein